MIRRIQSLPYAARIFTFLLFFLGGIVLIVAVTILLINQSPRNQAYATAAGTTVQEYVTLPDEDAYPATVAVDSQGVVYTASYVSGRVWRVPPVDPGDTPQPVEFFDSAETVGAVSGLAVGPDGTLYILDRVDSTPGQAQGIVWRGSPAGFIDEFFRFEQEAGAISPDDIALDGAGNVYVSDRAGDVVWRIAPDGGDHLAWWRPTRVQGTDSYEPSGLAYDPINDAILVTDTALNAVFRVPVAAEDPAAATQTLYLHGDRPNAPGLAGLTVTPGGEIYVAALGQNRVARLEGDRLVYIAEDFRGSSDVAAGPDGALYVTNWNQFSLLVTVLTPRLPFALDVITFETATE